MNVMCTEDPRKEPATLAIEINYVSQDAEHVNDTLIRTVNKAGFNREKLRVINMDSTNYNQVAALNLTVVFRLMVVVFDSPHIIANAVKAGFDSHDVFKNMVKLWQAGRGTFSQSVVKRSQWKEFLTIPDENGDVWGEV